MAMRLPHLQKKRLEKDEPATQNHYMTASSHAPQAQEQPTNQHQQYGQTHKGRSLRESRPIFPSTSQIKPFDKHGYRKGEPAFPPPQSLYTSRDTQVDPRFLRATCSTLSGPLQKTTLPIALWVTPFASDEVPVVQLTAPLRCHRCKSYVNPYFQFDGTRRSVTCNLCGLRFGVEQSIDKLNLSSTEIATQSILDFRVSDKFYMKKRTDIVKIIVLVELSMSMMEVGIFATVLDSVKSVLESHQFEQKVRIGIAFYGDQGVGFLRPGLQDEEPTVFSVPQGKGSSGCCPLSDSEFLLDPNTQRDQLIALVDFLQKYSEFIWKQGRFTHSANYVFAVRCIRDNFDQQTGRILLFSLLDPRTPVCQIRPRNQQESKTPLKPLHLEGHEYAKELLRTRIGIDHFIFSKDALVSHELATMHFLSSSTGGKLHHYTHYNSQVHGQHLYYAIFHSLTKMCIYDVDFTCRVSNGLMVTRYGASDGLRESRDVGLSVVDSTSSFTVEIDQEEKLEEHIGAFAQFAAMYTNGSGERRIRVINFKFEVSNRPGALYESIDYLTLSNVILRNYSSKLIRGGDPNKTREDAIGYIGSIIGEARARYSGTTTSVGDLSVPPGMAWSLAYLSSGLNSRLFLNWMKSSPDARIVKYLYIHQLNPYFFSARYYPKLYPLTLDIYEVEEGSPMPGDFIQEQEAQEDNKIAILPANLPLTKQSLKDVGVFLVDCGEELTVYVEPQADQDLLFELFGTADLQEIEAGGLPELQTSHSIRVANIVAELRRRSALNGGMYQPLSVKTSLKKGPYNEALAHLLIEDTYECTFSTFLEQIQKATVVPK